MYRNSSLKHFPELGRHACVLRCVLLCSVVFYRVRVVLHGIAFAQLGGLISTKGRFCAGAKLRQVCAWVWVG